MIKRMIYKKNTTNIHLLKRVYIVAVLLLMSSFVFAQEIQVSGTVTDKTGETIIGASVTVRNAKTGTVTDIDGNYTINAPSNGTLVFSYLGMITKEVPVNGQTKISVKLDDNNQALEEVVVIGYGSMKKKDLTTAVSSVGSKEWDDRPIVSSAQALQGKAAGVQIVQPSGKPGMGMAVRVRGSSSLNAGNEPLYVVDGIPTTDISNLSPSDIQDMQILKDASSAAIYGARAANGVVLITTKQGKKGEAQVSLSMYAGFSKIGKTIPTLNTNDYYDLIEDIYGKGFVDRSKQDYTNWNDETFGTGSIQNYQLGISGGAENTTYYVSANYQNEKGIVAPAEFKRYTVRSNINTQVKKWVKLTSNMSFARTDNQNVSDNANAGRGGVILSVLNTPPFLSVWDKDNPGQYAPNPYNPAWENPIAQSSSYDFTRAYRFMGNVGLDFTILEGLHYKTSLSADYLNERWDKFIDPIKTGYGRANNGIGEYRAKNSINLVYDNLVTYDTKINEKHTLSAMGGFIIEDYNYDEGYIMGSDYIKGVPGLGNMTLNLANRIQDGSSTNTAHSLVSMISRVHYNYESRYLVTANFRADGSSKLHPKHRWGYFPSFSGAWRMSSEEFFKPLTHIVDDFKLRAGWGLNGNQGGIDDFTYRGIYNIQRVGEIGDGPNYAPSNMYNEDLTWETTRQVNFGIDLSLFRSRIILTADVYDKRTSDLLIYTIIPASNGLKNPLRNGGEMLNRGFEFNIASQNLTGEFSWSTDFNMSFNKNTFSQMAIMEKNPEGGIENAGNIVLTAPGTPLGSFFGYVAQGVNPDTGEITYQDLNKNGYTDVDDRTYIGDAQPDFTFGMTNNLSWKNFTLSMFLQGSYGNDIYNVTKMETESMNSTANQRTTVLDRWRRPGMITEIPKAGNPSNSWISTRFVEDGSYVRIKALTLAYNLKKDWIKRFGLASMNVYATANNLLTLTKYTGYDPEVSMTGKDRTAAEIGIDYGTYPQNKTFIFGVNLSF